VGRARAPDPCRTDGQPRPGATDHLGVSLSLQRIIEVVYVAGHEGSGAAVEQVVVERAGRGDIVLDFDADGLLLGLEIIGATALLRERHCLGSRADLTTRLGRAAGPRSPVRRHGSGRRGPALRP
jgi:uncharacterized protein YuzE